jgi:hypothetical protein
MRPVVGRTAAGAMLELSCYWIRYSYGIAATSSEPCCP